MAWRIDLVLDRIPDGDRLGGDLPFVIHGRLKREASVIFVELFRKRSFAIGSFVSFNFGFGLYAFSYSIAIFMQSAPGFSAMATGFALLLSGIGLVLVIPVAGQLADRYPPYRVTMAGLILCGASFLLLSALGGRQ